MLGYLLEPFIQIQNINGTPISGAKIYVYNADTSDLSVTYNDFEGHFNTNPVITDELGNATIIADDGIEYDISVHDENDLLLFTKKHISIDKTSSTGGNVQVVPGYGITVSHVGNTFTVSVDTDLIATQDDLADKQDKLTPGDNISISDENVISVVNRKELVTQYPLRMNRSNDRVTMYLDSDYSNEFKTKQTPVEYGGANGQYISYLTQNTNGEIVATVSETDFPTFDNIHAGANIGITRNGNDLTISGKDWSSDIQNAPSTYSWDVKPYIDGNNITIDPDHVINSKDWSSDISTAVSTKLDTSTFNTYVTAHANDDVTPYTGGTGISVSNHQISCTGDITAYTGGTGITVVGHQISCTGDITAYTGGTGITVVGHQISIRPHSDYRVVISKEYTVTANNQYITVSLVDEFETVRTWLNLNYHKMTCPLFFTVQAAFDSQVQNPGMVYMDYGYSASVSGDPAVSVFTPYAYITKFWTGYSDAQIAGCIEAKSMNGYASLFQLRNLESTTKWTTGQKLTVTVSFYTQYIG